MHYATDAKASNFIFFTKDKSRKCANLGVGEKAKASLVIGFSEEEWIEFQAEGEIEKIDKTNSKKEEAVFATKLTGRNSTASTLF